MEIKDKVKPYVPHIVAVIFFIVISFVYFYPVLEGKVLKANDSTVSSINSKEIRDYRDKFQKEPLWTNSIFSGMPAYLISTRYPGNLLKYVDSYLRIFKMPVGVLFITMLGFYILLIIFGVNPWLSLTGAVAYGLSSFFFQILSAGHNTQAIALAYMAPMIGGIWYAYRKDAIKGALFTAFMLSLELIANHPQITYYGLLCVFIFGIVEFIYSFREKTIVRFLKTTAILVVPFVIALGINFAGLYTVYEYGKYSIRGKSELISDKETMTSGLNKDYILHWSYGVDETVNLLIPNYKGGGSKPFDRESETFKALRQNNAVSYANQFQSYWGTQPGTDGPHYVGAIVIFLFVLGLIVIRGPERWWLLAATILSIMLAWGKNFMVLSNLFIEYFPGYNKFRAVTMILVIAQFCIPLLGFLALRDIFSGKLSKEKILKSLQIATAVTGGFILIILIFPGIAGSFITGHEAEYPEWLKNALVADRKQLLQTDGFRSLLFILLASGTLFGFAWGKIKKEYVIVALTVLVTADLWLIGKRYLDSDRFERPAVIQKSFTPSVADAAILDDPAYKRVLNMSVSTFNDNSPTSYFHSSIGGYHGAKMRRYQELIDSSIIKEIMMFGMAANSSETIEGLTPVLEGAKVLNMLNTKYIILDPGSPPMRNPYSLGNAWFVEKPLLVENANKELAALKSFNPLNEAAVDIKFKNQINAASYQGTKGDTIHLVSYKPDELVYKSSSAGERMAIFSEIYYPAGWKSFVDGKEVPHFRANYVLRGMIVPAGDHDIKFSFEPASYKVGNMISLLSSLILILITAGFIIISFRKKSEQQ